MAFRNPDEEVDGAAPSVHVTGERKAAVDGLQVGRRIWLSRRHTSMLGPGLQVHQRSVLRGQSLRLPRQPLAVAWPAARATQADSPLGDEHADDEQRRAGELG